MDVDETVEEKTGGRADWRWGRAAAKLASDISREANDVGRMVGFVRLDSDVIFCRKNDEVIVSSWL